MKKYVLVAAAFASAAAIYYLGQLDERAGRTLGFFGQAVAAESSEIGRAHV